jgi:hypothetical protein
LYPIEAVSINRCCLLHFALYNERSSDD